MKASSPMPNIGSHRRRGFWSWLWGGWLKLKWENACDEHLDAVTGLIVGLILGGIGGAIFGGIIGGLIGLILGLISGYIGGAANGILDEFVFNRDDFADRRHPSFNDVWIGFIGGIVGCMLGPVSWYLAAIA